MILVTGATGFLGANLCLQLLNEGQKVRAIRRSSSSLPLCLSSKAHLIEWIEGDLTDYYTVEDALEGISEVYHCAAKVSFNQSDSRSMLQNNVLSTSNIVDACLHHHVRLLHVSSVAALGLNTEHGVQSENDYWEYKKGQSAYAISKYESEMEVWRGIAEGLDALIINPSIIIGKGMEDFSQGHFLRRLKQGVSFYPKGTCGMVEVHDVVNIMLLLMRSGISGQRFVINSENVSYQSLFTWAAEASKSQAPSRALEKWHLQLLALLDTIQSTLRGTQPSLNFQTANTLSSVIQYNGDKLKSTLNYSFTPIKSSIQAMMQ